MRGARATWSDGISSVCPGRRIWQLGQIDGGGSGRLAGKALRADAWGEGGLSELALALGRRPGEPTEPGVSTDEPHHNPDSHMNQRVVADLAGACADGSCGAPRPTAQRLCGPRWRDWATGASGIR